MFEVAGSIPVRSTNFCFPSIREDHRTIFDRKIEGFRLLESGSMTRVSRVWFVALVLFGLPRIHGVLREFDDLRVSLRHFVLDAVASTDSDRKNLSNHQSSYKHQSSTGHVMQFK